MGAVLLKEEIYDALMDGPQHLPELFHGYTYSGHPVAAAAALAALDCYDEQGSFEADLRREALFADLLHSFHGHPLVVDVRNFGLMGAIELASLPGQAGARGLDVHKRCFWDESLVVRNGGDTLQFAPFLAFSDAEVVRAFASVRFVLDRVR